MTTQLIVERGSGTGKRILVTSFPATIGRDSSNTVVLNDEKVSRFHFRIKKRGRLFILEDLESSNGTYINGDRVLNSIVQNGDKILAGSTELAFYTSRPEVQIANEIMKFNMVVGEDLGLNGPIDITSKPKLDTYTPIRLNPIKLVNQMAEDIHEVRKIYDVQGDIMVVDDLEEAAKALLKYIGQLSTSTARAALFIWVPHNRQLVPIAARHFRGDRTPFLLSQRSLEDALSRKQGILLQGSNADLRGGSNRSRIVLPIVNYGETICLIHLEGFDGVKEFPVKELELIQTLANRSAANFDSLLLRREIDSLMVGMVETMVATIEAKDTYTVGHSERVCRYSMAIADELRLNRELKKLLMISSLCHDIGKIGIPDAILKKASLLSNDEYEEMKLHPSIGADIISHMPKAHKFISGVKYHHEKWDGTGYPDGLVGEEIPFFGRIVAVADVFDAMISGRSYSGFVNESDAVQKIQDETELFDPEIIKALVKAWDNGVLTQKTSTQTNHPKASEFDSSQEETAFHKHLASTLTSKDHSKKIKKTKP
jgi:HD-GYP domain-containing protein (c-di-GMP phosphodiesterase class II)